MAIRRTRRIGLVAVCLIMVFCWNFIEERHIAMHRAAHSQFGLPQDPLLHDQLENGMPGMSTGRRMLALANNCTPVAVEQFPRPLISKDIRQKGGLVVEVLIALFMFLGLAIICDDYFVPSLERICDVLKLQPDVAGATFMAAGSSAPELATSVIAVFITKDDIGVGTVVGSAVFNIMFVIGLCAMCTTAAMELDWWPMTRDCIFYLISISALLLVIFDEVITWYESVIFLVLYFVYCVAMYYNPKIEVVMKRIMLSRCKDMSEKSRLVIYDKMEASISESDTERRQPPAVLPSGTSDDSVSSLRIERDAEACDVFKFPDTCGRRTIWILSLPFVLAFYVTVPDCRKHRWRNWFLVTFFMSVLWVSVLSYFLVWMIAVIGYTFGIPDTVMGLTFLAAGVSVPDAFASLLVLKEGFADMAVANAIGSNVFDILLCLGLPWFLQTVIISPNSTVAVFSKGLTYSTISLFSTVIFLLLATHFNGWKLNKPLGVALLLWYLLFMVIASLYELNVFGYFNPPECPSDF